MMNIVNIIKKEFNKITYTFLLNILIGLSISIYRPIIGKLLTEMTRLIVPKSIVEYLMFEGIRLTSPGSLIEGVCKNCIYAPSGIDFLSGYVAWIPAILAFFYTISFMNQKIRFTKFEFIDNSKIAQKLMFFALWIPLWAFAYILLPINKSNPLIFYPLLFLGQYIFFHILLRIGVFGMTIKERTV